MTIATAYVLGASRSYPIMQLDFKENIQNATNGKVYVKLAPGGQLGAGGALAQKVQGGTIQAAQHSLSNFAPFAPAADLINLPYFCGSNQRFVNLVFGFKDILSHVTFTQAVPDSQVYSCNAEWFNGLPSDVKEGIEFASDVTFQQNLAKVPAARAYAMSELTKSGVQFHSLNDDQLAEWKAAGGYQRSEWDTFKTELAGSMEAFAKLEEGANTASRYYVHDA